MSPPELAPGPAPTAWLPGKSEMASRMRAFEWANTPLGPASAWLPTLRTVVNILLTSRHPMWVGWGEQLTFLYNDAYRPMLGLKHPWALGTPASQVWPETWPEIGPLIETVLSTGEATLDEARLLFLERGGFQEETYHTFSYSPVIDDAGRVNGMFCLVAEETERVIGERRMTTLCQFASELAAANTEQRILAAVEHHIGANAKDLPFSLTYLFEDADSRSARLVCATGIAAGHPGAPERIEAGAAGETWPAGQILEHGLPIAVQLSGSTTIAFPTGAWNKPPEQGIVAPIKRRGKGPPPAGFWVAALNPNRPCDAAYTGFIEILASQLAAAFANAEAHEEDQKRVMLGPRKAGEAAGPTAINQQFGSSGGAGGFACQAFIRSLPEDLATPASNGVAEQTAQLRASNEEFRIEIAERKRTEGLLRDANQKIEMILDSITDNFFSLDNEFRFVYLNKRAQEQIRRLGKDPARLLGKVLWDEFSDVPNEAAIRRVVTERVAITDELYYPPLKEWVENHMYPQSAGGLASFQRYITDRKRAEAESLTLRNELAAELAAMTRLHDFSTRLLANTELKPLLEEVLNAIMALQNADFGAVQLYNRETGQLEIVIQRGFQQDFLDHFANRYDGAAAYGRALQQRRRLITEDVQTDRGFAPHREMAASAGFRAVQSTPLFSRRGEPLGVMATHFRQPHRPSERDLRLTDLYAGHAAEMIERTQSETALLQYHQELQAMAARLVEAQEMESKYLARELHDDFSQKLAGLGMEIAALAHRTSSEEICHRLLDFTAQIGALSKDIHRISRQLHSAVLDDLGLAAALKNECVAFAEQHGIPAEFDPDEIPRVIPDEVSLCLYRVAQECLRNVGKHAKATEVRVAISGGPDEIAMEIADGGGGFDPERIKGKGGLGLISMEERVRLVNGAFSIQSQPGKGTLVKVRVPLSRSQS